MFEFESKKHLILVDYYSKYIDVMELHSESTTAVIKAMKQYSLVTGYLSD